MDISKKIIIAIKNDFIRETYSEVFKGQDFLVFKTKKGKEVLTLTEEEKPDIIIVDVDLPDLGGFEVLKTLREKKTEKEIPIIIFSQIEKKAEKMKAIELEAKDFIAATDVTPSEAIRKIKIALGEQKSYMVAPQKHLFGAKELIADLGYDYDFKCPTCGSDLVFDLIRDLSKGEKYFIVSIICPKCKK